MSDYYNFPEREEKHRGKVDWAMTRIFYGSVRGSISILEHECSGTATVEWDKQEEFQGWRDIMEDAARTTHLNAVESDMAPQHNITMLSKSVAVYFWTSPIYGVEKL